MAFSRHRHTRLFPAAQVTIGGAQRAAFQPETMEALSQPGFYAAGEVLDVDAYTGGYNLGNRVRHSICGGKPCW